MNYNDTDRNNYDKAKVHLFPKIKGCRSIKLHRFTPKLLLLQYTQGISTNSMWRQTPPQKSLNKPKANLLTRQQLQPDLLIQ